MKRLIILVFSLGFFCCQWAFSQTRTTTKQMLQQCFSAGFVSDDTVILYAKEYYSTLPNSQRSSILNDYCLDRTERKIVVHTSNYGRELWIKQTNQFILAERWDNDDLSLSEYMPLSIRRQGESRWYYYYGGSLAGGKGTTSFCTSLRVGTYLFKDYLDVSSSLNLGYSSSNENHQFSGDIGASSRAYLPFRLKNLNMAPYGGAGVSFSFAPTVFLELQLMAGACWFIGPGSLDFGFQYGIKSKGMLSVGYTFRPSFNRK